MKFGLHNNSFITNGGLAEEIFPELKNRAQWLENNGFSYISFMDHFWQIPGVGPADHPFMEPWVTMGAIAASTEKINITTMVTSVGYRNPALLAKMATTLDVISGGRSILGIGAGWYEAEYLGYGYEFPRPSIRLSQLREAVKMIKQLWSENITTFEGNFFSLNDAVLEPKSIKKPRPRILIGGGGEKVILRIVAQEADMCNFMMANPEVFQHKLTLLQGYCQELGRDVSEIEVTKLDRLCLAPSESKAEEKWNARGGRLPEGYRSLVGTADQAIERLSEFKKLGLDTVFVSVANDDYESLAIFSEQVIPALASI